VFDETNEFFASPTNFAYMGHTLRLKKHISPEKKAKRLFCIKIFEVRMKLDKMHKERRSGKV
jgi:hypothetical protein